MFWIFLLAVGLAATFTKLGAASVMVSVLSVGLLAAVLLIAILTILLMWKHFFKREGQVHD